MITDNGVIDDQDPDSQGVLPSQPAAPPFPQQGGSWFGNAMMNPMVLAGLGLASGKTPQEGLGNMARLGMQGAQLERNQQTQMQTYHALLRNGLSPDLALAASRDPKVIDMMIKMAPQVVERGKDILNQPQFVRRSPLTGQEGPYSPVVGGMGTQGAVGPGGGGIPTPAGGGGESQQIGRAMGIPNWQSLQEPGAQNMSPEQYLAQWPKEIQSTVQGMLDGRIPWSPNPRPGPQTGTQYIAARYGDMIGQPMDTNSIKERLNYINKLNNTNPSSVGGQRIGFNTIMEHGANAAEAAVDLKNSDLGFSPLSTLVNNMRNMTTEQQAKVKRLQYDVDKWNAEVEKLYAGGPGSITQREHDRLVLDPNASPQELAAVFSEAKSLAQGKLNGLDTTHQEVLGPRLAAKRPMIMPQTVGNMARIDAAVKTLRQQSQGKKTGPSESVKRDAAAWAAANPKDPRAYRIRQKLGLEDPNAL